MSTILFPRRNGAWAVLFAFALVACHHDDGHDVTDLGMDLSALPDSGPVDDDLSGPLVLMPQSPSLTVGPALPAASVSFTATVNGQPVNAAFSTDRGELGSIDATGKYTATGTLGGVGNVFASYGTQTVSTPIKIVYQETQLGDPAATMPIIIGTGGYGGVGGNGPGTAPTAMQQTVLGGNNPTADPAVTWLYPYDGTVFPAGLNAPLLMWNPATHNFDGVRVQMSASNGTFSYNGEFAAPAGGQPFINLPIPQATWQTMNLSAAGATVSFTITFSEGANLVGPLKFTMVIAAGLLRGTVYYNSYGTSLVTNSYDKDYYHNYYGAGTLGIESGANDPVLVAGLNITDGSGDGCRVCHSVAKNGSVLITQEDTTGSGDNYQTSRIENLSVGPPPTYTITGTEAGGPAAGNSAFPALYPDGSRFFSSSGGMINGDTASQLYTLPAGTLVANPPGLPSGLQAALPSFSADGTLLVFNWYGGTGSDTFSLATMTFDASTNTFGPVTKLVTPPGGFPAVWPAFLPGNNGVVYEVESVGSNGWGYTWHGNQGQLSWVDLATQTAHTLDQLNGTGYLPTGPNNHTDDTQLNYEPTVNPVPSGGYAWVVFTSRRLYGNVATADPTTSDPRDYAWKSVVTTKKLWMAAIDLNAPAGTDPSHPAFYLPAQELYAGNSRGFFAVDPCLANGSSCQTGDECCGGYCVSEPGDGGTGLFCSATKPSCAALFDKCATTADCCPSASGGSVSCINGYCSMNTPIQ